jgi:hypothetical protein
MSNEIQPTNQSSIQVSDEVKAILAQAAKTQGDAEASSIPYMSIKGKKFTIGDEKLGTTLDVVILADMFDHAYYDKDYDPDTVSPPACWAIGPRDTELVPDLDAPVRQAESCNECPQNQFGSKGKGKACRNGRRLLLASVVTLDTGEKRTNLDDLAILNIPPTSLKAYARYTKNITVIHKLPTWAVITKLTFDEDSAWPSIVPLFVSPVDAHTIGKASTMLNEYTDMVSQPYDCSGYIPVEEVVADGKKKSKMS